MMYLTADEKDTFVTYLRSMSNYDAFRKGYEAGFQQAVKMAWDFVKNCNFDDDVESL